MKNLSKVLSLVLALTMILGIFTIGASATFTDDEDINYDEAVAVLAAINVLEGYEDGSFRPEGTVTREQAAAIVCRMLLTKGVADMLPCTTAPFSDVAANRWSAGYIAYCAQEGIISGYGDGTFGPTKTVTGFQLAKMLLVAIGFDAEENGLVGAGWDIATAKLALSKGIFTGSLTNDYTAAATREEASQYAFNALWHSEIGSTTDKIYGITGWETKEVGGQQTLVPVYGWIDVVNPGADSLAASVFALSISNNETQTKDAFGRPAKTYLRNGTTAIATFTSKPALTYTTPVTTGTIYKDLGLATGTTGTKVAHVKNGETQSEVTVALNGKDVLGGFGVVTEVYRLPDNTYRIVTVEPTLGQVSAAVPGKETNGSTFTQYTIANKADAGKPATGKVYTTALNQEPDTIVLNGKVAIGDYVTFYNVGGVTYVTPVTTVTGTLTGYSSATGTYTIGGKPYMLSSVLGTVAPSAYNVEATYALDAHGYVVTPVDAVQSSTNYLYLINDTRESWTLNGNMLTKSIVGDVVFYDGTVSTITVTETKTAGLYTYTANPYGVYELEAKTANTNASLKPFDPTIASGKYANNETKFFYVNWNADGTFAGTVNTITGYANISASDTVVGSYVDADNNGIAEVVFVKTSKAAVATTNYAYYLGTYSTDGKTKAYDFIVNGEKVAIADTTGLSAAGMYNISASNVATAVNFGTDEHTYANKKVEFKGGLLYVDGNYVAPVADNVPVYTFAYGACTTGTAAGLAAPVTGNVIVAYGTTGIAAIYIVIA